MRRILWAAMITALLGSGAAAFGRPLRVPPRDVVVVLYSAGDPAALRQLDCPEGRCTFVSLDADPCRAGGGPAQAVIVTGHSTPPVYLGGSPQRLARAIACFEPEIVVLDTCYGFSSPLLDALAAEGQAPLMVGSTRKLPPTGLSYGARFYAGGGAESRAADVQTRSGAPLERWRLVPRALEAAEEQASHWDRATLEARLRRLHPNLVEVDVPGSDAVLLVPVAPERFRR